MSAVESSNPKLSLEAKSVWVAVLGFATLLLPTVFSLSQQTWTEEAGAHGPIILAAGAWLLWRERARVLAVAQPGALWIAVLLQIVGSALYVVGRAFDFITLEAGGLYVAGLAIFYGSFGWRAMKVAWFPLAYLAFAVPPPALWLDRVTFPLKQFVSYGASELLHGLGFPVARSGVVIVVAQYQLLVENACSGLNSLIGLSAVTLLYVYLRRGPDPSFRRLGAVLLAALPIAIAANVVRIMTLILITYYLGDAWGESFLHVTAGLLLFVVALGLVFLFDEALSLPLLRRRSPAP